MEGCHGQWHQVRYPGITDIKVGDGELAEWGEVGQLVIARQIHVQLQTPGPDSIFNRCPTDPILHFLQDQIQSWEWVVFVLPGPFEEIAPPREKACGPRQSAAFPFGIASPSGLIRSGHSGMVAGTACPQLPGHGADPFPIDGFRNRFSLQFLQHLQGILLFTCLHQQVRCQNPRLGFPAPYGELHNILHRSGNDSRQKLLLCFVHAFAGLLQG